MSERMALICDQCYKVYREGFGEWVRLSCGHDYCVRHHMSKNERGEILCARGCPPGYIREQLS